MSSPSLRIESFPGFSPLIGRLVCMLTLVRDKTLKAVSGLTTEQLDYLHDADGNSIGALLWHIATVERIYQIVSFEGRELLSDEEAEFADALALGASGRTTLRGRPLDDYLEELAVVRQATLAELVARDDAWLERSLPHAPEMNPDWAWFHVAEDEISHRGQIRWLLARIPAAHD